MKTYLETEESNLMGDAATNLRDRLLIHMLFRLGCRISEALAPAGLHAGEEAWINPYLALYGSKPGK